MRSGAVNVIQRFGGALNLNIHFHALFIDGVYTRDAVLAPARFHELPAPSQEDVEWTLARIHSRLRRLLEGRTAEDATETRGAWGPEASDLLVHLARASIRGQKATGHEHGQRLAGLFTPELDQRSRPSPVAPLAARGAGFSLHAAVSVPAERRGRLEQLCRYIARPPLATERLSLDAHGRILYAFRQPHANGQTHAVFTPKSLLERLCALIPFPRTHLLTYHGVLAPASSWRDEVVPGPTHGVRARAGSATPASLDRRLRWAELMKRTFGLDLLTCECGAERVVIGCVLDRGVAAKILRHLGLPHEAPRSTPSRAPPVLEFGV